MAEVVDRLSRRGIMGSYERRLLVGLFTKKLTVPVDNATLQIDVAQTWEVRWISRSGLCSYDTQKEAEFFTDYDEALAFQIALQNAFKLIRHSSDIAVTLTKSKSV